MVVISELSGGSNGGDDPNKNLQEENQDEDPQDGVEENQNENNLQEVEENLPPQELPEDVMAIIVARVSSCYYYPVLSCVCRAFRQLITSQQLFQTRTRLDHGVTEPVLYVLMGFSMMTTYPRWVFLLHRRNNVPLRLSRVPSLPPMFPGSAAVTIGHKIYVMGGYVMSGYLCVNQALTNAIFIDCRLHTWGHLPNMQRARYNAAAGVIDGKIYVIGGRTKQDEDWIEVFDVTTEVWETVPSECPNDASVDGMFGTSVVMQGRIFILDRQCCLAYEPRHGLWQSWELESQLKRFWHPLSCVVRDLLYAYDPTCSLAHPILVYHPNELVWRPVMGVSTYQLPMLRDDWSKMANVGGKLVILGNNYWSILEIRCVEIALETRNGDQIWGKVESVSPVFTGGVWTLPSIEFCRTVTV
ncbi:PREDICTED: F-box/kelch-repeat protein At2g29830-like [Camelina sativa]|uniref:F-box/kelch-repeat protein At2g29830-like n=1 Tax=Camelina sativa TaxID=90675 RepID=A0ABM0ZBF3_CAMSA|nr:PREDICTED: F-box/kelch-repeat protein At2g29830-like [Camelina sativa]